MPIIWQRFLKQLAAIMIVTVSLVYLVPLVSQQRAVTILTGALPPTDFAPDSVRLRFRYLDVVRGRTVTIGNARIAPPVDEGGGAIVDIHWDRANGAYLVNNQGVLTGQRAAKWLPVPPDTVDLSRVRVGDSRFWEAHWRVEYGDRFPVALNSADWSLDGQHAIVIAADRSVSIVDIPDFDARPLDVTDTFAPFTNFIWSPDNHEVAIVSGNPSLLLLLLIASANGAPTETVAIGVGANAVWSPDGSRLAYSEGQSVVILDTATRESVATFETDMVAPFVDSWSGDGRWLLLGRRSFHALNITGGDLIPIGQWSGEIGSITNQPYARE